MFHNFLKGMAQVEFGDFHLAWKYFTNESFVNTPELAKVNVSQLMLDVSSRKVQIISSLKELVRINIILLTLQPR